MSPLPPSLPCFVSLPAALNRQPRLRPPLHPLCPLRRTPRPRPHLRPARHVPRLCAAPSDAPSATPPPNLAPLPALRNVLCGLLSSTVGALIGAGGGILLTPLLTLSAVSQHAAHGTSLVVISFTALVSALRYLHSAQADLPAALLLMTTALLAAPVGARASATLDAPRLRRCFGAFLLFASILIPLLPRLAFASSLALPAPARAALLLALGAASGFLSGLLGIGGGTVNVPALILLAGFPQKVAQGTALMAMVLPSVRGAYAHLQLRQVRVDMLPGLIVGAVAGGFIGASAALRLPETALRIVCSVVFALMGVRYLSKGQKVTKRKVEPTN